MSNWCTRWFEIWKWIQFGDQADALGISNNELFLMIGGDERAVQMVERMRKRMSGGQLAVEEVPPPSQKRFPSAAGLDSGLTV